MDKTGTKFNVIAVLLIFIFCISITPVTLQNDTYYTIKIGEYIMQNGITGIDPFSWHEGLKYTFPHWAYDVMMYEIYNIGGFQGIYISTIIFACILGMCIYLVNIYLNKNKLISFFITILVMAMLADFIAARAQLVTFIFFILEIFSIEKFLQAKEKKYVIFLIIISIAIVNLHVAVWPFYFILFLPYIAEYLICYAKFIPLFILKIKKKLFKKNEEKINKINEKIEKNSKKPSKKPYKIIINKNNNVKWLIVIMIICILTGLLTPLGTTPYTYLYKTMQGETTKGINEHLPPTLYKNWNLIGAILSFVLILMFIDIKINLKDLFLVTGLIYLAISSRRQITMLALIGSIILVRLIEEFLNKYDKNISGIIEHAFTTKFGKIFISLIVIFISLNNYKTKVDDNYVDEHSYPVYAADYIKENLDLENMRLFNQYNYGSYLLFKGIPVFVDSRADLYSPEFNDGINVFSDFLNIDGIGTFYENKFNEYKITHVIVYKNSKLNMLLVRDSNYKKLYSDNDFYVYERLVKDE